MSKNMINNSMPDYRIYRMNFGEALTGITAGAAILTAITYLFFWNYKIALIALIPGGIAGFKIYKDSLRKKRSAKLLEQFSEFLEGLDSALSTGNVVFDALRICHGQLCNSYGKDSFICKEIERMILGVINGWQLFDMMNDFADRSGMEDIRSFADVFAVTVSRGGNVKEAVAYSRRTIGEKIEAEMNIKTRLESGRQELRIMMVLPLIILLMTSETNISMGGSGTFFIVKCIVMVMYVSAYFIGRRLLNVKI